ncbi:MAG TPA: prolipoprotein diacylglyceryl transferase [Candidatus Binatia bacterium]|nr:prolipoprotein diacylglyceryl transferase [Candidatus Binatia bacterium]
MLGVIQIGIDPTAFRIGSLAIHWYGVMYVVAFVVAYYLGAKPHARRRGIKQERIELLVSWTILWGLVGGRLYYDVQSLSQLHSPVDWIAVWNGGMAFYGAIIGSVATIVFLGWRWRLPIWVLLDAGAMFAVVGQPIGRIGNIINGDILGGPSNLPWATAYTNPNAVLQCPSVQSCFHLDTAYQPAGAYEALATLLILLILVWLRRRGVRPGVMIISYVALYSISQFALGFVRESEPVVWLGLKELQLTAVVAFVVGVPGLVWLWWRTGGGAAASGTEGVAAVTLPAEGAPGSAATEAEPGAVEKPVPAADASGDDGPEEASAAATGSAPAQPAGGSPGEGGS